MSNRSDRWLVLSRQRRDQGDKKQQTTNLHSNLG
jgi:hypothetical protein